MDTIFIPLIVLGSVIGIVIIFAVCDENVSCWRRMWRTREQPDLEQGLVVHY